MTSVKRNESSWLGVNSARRPAFRRHVSTPRSVVLVAIVASASVLVGLLAVVAPVGDNAPFVAAFSIPSVDLESETQAILLDSPRPALAIPRKDGDSPAAGHAGVSDVGAARTGLVGRRGFETGRAEDAASDRKERLELVAGAEGITTAANPQTSDQKDAARNTGKVTVFIGIKVGDPLGVRFDQVRRTWLIDALAESDRVKINFFTTQEMIDRALAWNGTVPPHFLGGGNQGGHLNQPKRKVRFQIQRREESSSAAAPATAPPLAEGDGNPSSLKSLLAPTGCADPTQLRCGTSSMFAYYLAHYSSDYSYFCSFDDDQYVLIRNLLSVLEEYTKGPPRYGRDIYLGNSPFLYKRTVYNMTLEQIWRKDMQRFLTGGAGYCLSSDLVERGRDKFVNLPSKYKNGDDVAVGHVVQQDLGVYPPMEDSRFHSHLEDRLRKMMPLGDVRTQVSFGYNTKKQSSKKRLLSWPRIRMLFSEGEDPMQFRSMRCFLNKEENGKYPSDCVAT